MSDPFDYEVQGGGGRLLDSLVLYLDSLGAKDRIGRLTEDDLLEELELIKETRHILDRGDVVSKERFKSFSDNVLLGWPVIGPMGTRQLRFMLTAAAFYQLQHVLRDRPLRGGVSRGPFFANDDVVTGQALVDAVLIEEKTAIFPRVVVDAGCYRSVKPNGGDDNRTAGGATQWEDLLLVDADGRLILNYLWAAGPTDIPAEIADRLMGHSQAVSRGLDENASSKSVLEKYVWMADYHNYVLGEFCSGIGQAVRVDVNQRDGVAPRVFTRFHDLPPDHTVTALLKSVDEL